MRKTVKALVVGMRFYGFDHLAADKMQAWVVSLVRESTNRHDPNAIAVSMNGKTIGHVDRNSAKMLAPIMDSGIVIEPGTLNLREATATAIPLSIFLTYEKKPPVAPRPCNEKSAGIYKISVSGTNSVYIGQSRDVNERLVQHWDALSAGTHHNSSLRHAWAKGSPSDFTAELIDAAPPELGDLELSKWLYERECHWISVFRLQGGVFNRSHPELVLTPAGRLAAAEEAQLRVRIQAEKRKRDRDRQAELKISINRLRSQIEGITVLINSTNRSIRKRSGFIGFLLYNDQDRSEIPNLRSSLDELNRTLSFLISEIKDARTEYAKIESSIKRKKPSRRVLDNIAEINLVRR